MNSEKRILRVQYLSEAVAVVQPQYLQHIAHIPRLFHRFHRRAPCADQDIRIAEHVRDFEVAQPVLHGAEKLSRPAQPQILFRKIKTTGGTFHRAKSLILRALFPAATLGRDGMSEELGFE